MIDLFGTDAYITHGQFTRDPETGALVPVVVEQTSRGERERADGGNRDLDQQERRAPDTCQKRKQCVVQFNASVLVRLFFQLYTGAALCLSQEVMADQDAQQPIAVIVPGMPGADGPATQLLPGRNVARRCCIDE